jgi:peptide methionine sulfoxide reductase MsrA
MTRPDYRLVYRWIDGNVYRKATGRVSATIYMIGFVEKTSISADYHRRYLAKNPGGYCPNHSCGFFYAPSVS